MAVENDNEGSLFMYEFRIASWLSPMQLSFIDACEHNSIVGLRADRRTGKTRALVALAAKEIIEQNVVAYIPRQPKHIIGISFKDDVGKTLRYCNYTKPWDIEIWIDPIVDSHFARDSTRKLVILIDDFPSAKIFIPRGLTIAQMHSGENSGTRIYFTCGYPDRKVIKGNQAEIITDNQADEILQQDHL